MSELFNFFSKKQLQWQLQYLGGLGLAGAGGTSRRAPHRHVDGLRERDVAAVGERRDHEPLRAAEELVLVQEVHVRDGHLELVQVLVEVEAGLFRQRQFNSTFWWTEITFFLCVKSTWLFFSYGRSADKIEFSFKIEILGSPRPNSNKICFFKPFLLFLFLFPN